MGAGCNGVRFFRHGLRLAQCEDGAARVGQHTVDRAVAGEGLECPAVRGAEHDEAGAAFRGQSENLDGRIAVDHDGLDGGAAIWANLRGENAQLEHGRGVHPCGQALALHFGDRRQNVKEDQLCLLGNSYLAGKRRARARGLSQCGGMQDDRFLVPRHREMSLGSHGNDREVDRAQHLFCHRAEEQLAKLAAAPSSKQHAVDMKLANGGCNLLRGMAFAGQRIAAHAEAGGNLGPGMHHLLRCLQSAGGVEAGHAGGVGGKD